MAGYNLLYVLAGLLLVYSLLLPFVTGKIKLHKETRTVVRRVYYSIWFFGMAYVMNNVDKVKAFGINKLGFNEEIMFLLILFLIGFLIDMFIISALEFKEITLPGGASFKGREDDITNQLDLQADLTESLTTKIEALYSCYVRLYQTIVRPVEEKLDRDEEVVFAQEFKKVLEKYVFMQEDWYLNVEVIEPKDMAANDNYGLTGEKLELFEKHMSAGKAFLHQTKDTRYMIIPYDSIILDSKVHVVMSSTQNDLVRVEYIMVLLLLHLFEDQLLDKFDCQVGQPVL